MADDGAVTLTSEEYWELRARAKEVEYAELALSLTPQGQQLRATRADALKTLESVTAKYGLDASVTWTLDETLKALIPVTPQTPPK